jgi:deoxyribonuclease-4
MFQRKIMLHIGCHLSAAKGYLHMGQEAVSIGADTFQFFTRNPRGGNAKEISQQDVSDFLSFSTQNHLTTLLAHAPYTINPCSDNPQTREFAELAMSDDLKRMEYTPHNLYNFHPGSHVGQGVAKAIDLISDLLNRVLSTDITTTVLLETMSGKGSEVGATFEELRSIIDNIDLSDKIGICLDTCHIYSAGYDIVNDLEGVLEKFDKVIGLNRLKAIHLNDSMTEFASHKDRHEKIGLGTIGADALIRLINHPALKHLPFLLETPNELDGYAQEIKFLRQNYSI